MPVGHITSTEGTYVPVVEPLDLVGELILWDTNGWLWAIPCTSTSVSSVLVPSLTSAVVARGGDICCDGSRDDI